jgi:hypothetical protein
MLESYGHLQPILWFAGFYKECFRIKVVGVGCHCGASLACEAAASFRGHRAYRKSLSGNRGAPGPPLSGPAPSWSGPRWRELYLKVDCCAGLVLNLERRIAERYGETRCWQGGETSSSSPRPSRQLQLEQSKDEFALLGSPAQERNAGWP